MVPSAKMYFNVRCFSGKEGWTVLLVRDNDEYKTFWQNLREKSYPIGLFVFPELILTFRLSSETWFFRNVRLFFKEIIKMMSEVKDNVIVSEKKIVKIFNLKRQDNDFPTLSDSRGSLLTLSMAGILKKEAKCPTNCVSSRFRVCNTITEMLFCTISTQNLLEIFSNGSPFSWIVCVSREIFVKVVLW